MFSYFRECQKLALVNAFAGIISGTVTLLFAAKSKERGRLGSAPETRDVRALRVPVDPGDTQAALVACGGAALRSKGYCGGRGRESFNTNSSFP